MENSLTVKSGDNELPGVSTVRNLFLPDLLWITMKNGCFLFYPKVLHTGRFILVLLSSVSASEIPTLQPLLHVFQRCQRFAFLSASSRDDVGVLGILKSIPAKAFFIYQFKIDIMTLISN